jgi:hypothetical protein
MDPQVSASFIPKKPLAESRPRGGSSGLLFLLALLIFIASIISAGGAFLYGRYLGVSLDAKKDSLAKYQQAYDLPTIQALVRFDSRINEANKVLKSHLAPSAIFAFLSQQTLEKVQFSEFTYTVGATDQSAEIEMMGVTDSFATIALQSDQLGGSKALKDIIFSNITIQEGGKVAFSVSATVDPALILYSNNYDASQFSGLTPVPTDTPAPTQ